MRLWVCSLVLLVWSRALGQVTQQSCDVNQGTVDYRVTGANAVIGGLFNIHQSGAPSTGCGPINLEMVQVFEAAKWAINQVNLARPINRRIGMKAYDTCTSADIAVNRFLDFYPEYQSLNYNCSQSSSTVNLGTLGPYDSASAIAVSELANTDIPAPVLSPGASTPELDANNEAPFFIRTIPSDSSKVKAIIALLKHLIWNRVVIFYSDDLYGQSGYDKLVEVAYQENICVVHGISISSNMGLATIRDRYQLAINSGVSGAVFFGTESVARSLMFPITATFPWVFSDLDISQPTKYNANFFDSFVVSSESNVVRGFRDYWSQINPNTQVDNPWYVEWYTSTYQCSSLATCPVKSFTERLNEYQQSPLVEATIAGIYAYDRALSAVEALAFQNIQDLTPNQFYDYIKAADFSITDIGQVAFDSNGNFRTGYMYDIFRFEGTSSFTMVGNYSSTSRALLLDVTGIPASDCPTMGCNDCILPQMMLDYTYIPGDILIGGAFFSHAAGLEPLTCGDLDSLALQHITATLYAMDNLKNAFPSILPGVDLGMIYFDYCSNDWLAKSFVSGLLSGRMRLKDNQNRRIEADEIKAFIETVPNPEFMAELLGSYNMPSINPWATNPELSDTTLYPYYTSSVPNDVNQVFAILDIVKKMGWSHVQVVHISAKYGTGALDHIRNAGSMMSICVSASYVLDEAKDANDVVQNLRLHPRARVVIVFLLPHLVNAIFQEMKALTAQGEFVLIGSELWGTENVAVAGVEDVATGSITLQLTGETSLGLDAFINSVSGFDEWYEQLHSCYRRTENQDKYSVPCGTSALTSSPLYQQFSYAPYTINALYALAHALDETLKQFCGSPYVGVCSAFRGSPAVNDVILKKLRDVSFTDAGKTFTMRRGQGVTGYEILNYGPAGYTNIGNYDLTSHVLTFDSANWVANPTAVGSVLSDCLGRCIQCDYVESFTPTFKSSYAPGNVIIGGLLGMHKFIEGQAVCQIIDDIGLQYPMTIDFALDQVNSGKGPVLLNGVTLGSVIVDHCGNPARTKSVLSSIYNGELNLNLRAFRAWITDTTPASIEVNDLIKNQSIPIISPAATPIILTDREVFPTFFRTLPGDDKTARAIAKLLLNLNFGFVQLVSSDDEYGMSGAAIFRSFALQEGICVLESHEVGSQDNATEVILRLLAATTDVVVLYVSPVVMGNLVRAKAAGPNLIFVTPYLVPEVTTGTFSDGMLSLSVPNINNNAFNQYYDTMRMSMLYYGQLLRCDVPGSNVFGVQCSTLMSSMWTNYATPTINAIYAFSVALNSTLETMCGTGHVGLCDNFLYSEDTNQMLLSALEEATFLNSDGSIFSFRNRDGDIAYNVNQWKEGAGAYFHVASYKDATLTFTDTTVAQYYPSVESTCFLPCVRCLSGLLNFTYIPGDILLGGLFDAHEKNINAFSCGAINTIKGFELLEAFNYALQSVNDGMFPGILNGVKLGGVGLDTCQSSIRTGYLVSNLHNGLMVLNRDGKDIDPKTIDTYIGSYSSDRSIHLARILRGLEIPQISYGSTSIELDDGFRYPYFLRTVPSDDKQAAAMAQFLDRYDLRYVQVVHSRDSYGISAKDAFSNLASNHQLCVAQTVTIPVNGTLTNEIFNDVVLSMLDKPAANTIVLFAPSNYVNALLRAIGRNVEAQGKFHFLGSESWANSADAIAGVTQWAVDSITLKPGGKKENTKFRDYLMTKLPGNYPENPWFPEYYEEIHNCYLSVPRAPYTLRCQTSTLPVTEAIGRYAQDPSVNDVVNAVYSAAIGIHETLVQYCGPNYQAVCEAYRSATLKRGTILTKIKNVTFVDDVDNTFFFEEMRNGNKGYFFQQIEEEGSYNDMGIYTSDGRLEVTYTNRWDGSCDRTGACSECPSVRNRLARYSITYPSQVQSTNIATIAGMFNIHNAGNDFRCGALRTSDFEKSLAFFYGIKLANDVNPGSIQRVLRFQGIAVDTCGSSLRVYQDVYNLISGNGLCNTDINFNGKDFGDSLVGFLTISSDSSMAASRVLSPLRVSQISPSARDTELSNFNEYPYFMRTVPPHQVAMSVVAQFLLENKWTHISTVFYDSVYGIGRNNDLKTETFKRRICVSLSVAASGTMTLDEAKAIVRQLEANEGATVVVLDVSSTVAGLIIQAISDLGLNDRFIIFGAIYQILEGNDKLVDGSLVVRVRSTQVPGFNSFVTNLQYNDHGDIAKDWFEEFYQNIHQCRLTDAKVQKLEFTKLCDKTEIITPAMFRHADYSLNTIYATYAMAVGSQFFFDANCDGISQLSDCLRTVDNARNKLFDAILSVQWPRDNPVTKSPTILEDNNGFPFNFTDGRYWDIGYTIEAFVAADNTFQPVARWWDNSFPNGTHYMEGRQKPESVCPSGNCGCVFPDDAGNPNAQTSGDSQATLRNYLSYLDDGTERYTWPIWAIVLSLLSCIGVIFTLIILIYLFIVYPVREGTTILGFMILIGILGIYAVNFAFFLPASEATCGARRFVLGMVYAICISAMLVKAIDNWRKKDAQYEKTKFYKGLTSSCGLLMATLGVILVQTIIPTIWLILVPPTWTEKSNAIQHDHKWCDPSDLAGDRVIYDIGLVLSMLFVIFLVLLTIVFAALGWDSESNSHESRWILVGATCTAGCFMVWMIVSTSADPPFRDVAVAIGNFVNASALFICIPLRKMLMLISYKMEASREKKENRDNENRYDDPATFSNEAFQTDLDFD